jgi:hypothetical protein
MIGSSELIMIFVVFIVWVPIIMLAYLYEVLVVKNES